MAVFVAVSVSVSVSMNGAVTSVQHASENACAFVRAIKCVKDRPYGLWSAKLNHTNGFQRDITNTHTYIITYKRLCVYMYMYMYIFVYVFVCVYVCMQMSEWVSGRVSDSLSFSLSLSLSLSVSVSVSVSVCVCACVCVRVYVYLSPPLARSLPDGAMALA